MSNSASSPATSASEKKQSTPNAIEWNELITPDPAGALRFYTELFGWKTEKFPLPQGDYIMLHHAGRTFGGVMAPPEPGVPPHWLNYVSVADIQSTVDKATSLGAKVIVAPMSIGDVGKIAVIQDQQGAMIGVHTC